MVRWIAGWNQPGCLPDSEPADFATRLDAVDYMQEELDRIADSLYGEDRDGEAEEFSSSAAFLRGSDAQVDGDWSCTMPDGYVYFIESVDD